MKEKCFDLIESICFKQINTVGSHPKKKKIKKRQYNDAVVDNKEVLSCSKRLLLISVLSLAKNIIVDDLIDASSTSSEVTALDHATDVSRSHRRTESQNF